LHTNVGIDSYFNNILIDLYMQYFAYLCSLYNEVSYALKKKNILYINPSTFKPLYYVLNKTAKTEYGYILINFY
jgi:hypothetical protein